jgi:hypothetical protein
MPTTNQLPFNSYSTVHYLSCENRGGHVTVSLFYFLAQIVKSQISEVFFSAGTRKKMQEKKTNMILYSTWLTQHQDPETKSFSKCLTPIARAVYPAPAYCMLGAQCDSVASNFFQRLLFSWTGFQLNDSTDSSEQQTYYYLCPGLYKTDF